MKFTRRDFIATTAVASASLALDLQAQSKPDKSAVSPGALPKKPVLICAHNGYNYLDRGYAVLTGGGDTLDAVMQVITGPEDDPNDDSVGLGGLPNEDCVVQLDACCMHGPTRMAGAVAAVEEIKNVSLLSKAVMEHTGHVMLVGEGAQKFGFKMGFPREICSPSTRARSGSYGAKPCPTTTGGGRGWPAQNSSFRSTVETTGQSSKRSACARWRNSRRRSASSRSCEWRRSNEY